MASQQDKERSQMSEEKQAGDDGANKSLYDQLLGFFSGSQENSMSNTETQVDKPNPRPPLDEDQWWNEYPLEGNPYRPAVIFAKLMSNSPRLIGWDDKKWEREAFEIMERRRAIDRLRPPDELPPDDLKAFPVNDDGKTEIKVSFGFIERVSDTVGDRIEKFVKASDMGMDESKESSIQDEDMIKDSQLYQTALKALRWQRDAYLVGPSYANQRQVERASPSTQDETTTPHFNWNDLTFLMISSQPQQKTVSGLPYDASALGNIQLARLGEWFIPSRVVQKALLPMVLGLPRGPLYQPAYKVTTNLIPMSQPTLDRVMKNTILWFLQDEQWRGTIKRSMNGYIATTYRDSSTRGLSRRATR